VAEATTIPVTIRSFEKKDAGVCQRLYEDGLIGGKIADNDTGVDIDRNEDAYMSAPDSHFWVAENEQGEVVGMIGVQRQEDSEAAIRRLRVRQEQRRKGIGTKLLETALHFCQERNYLKVTLDTFMDYEPAVKLFEKFKFKHSRTREVSEKTLLYFYLDLYSGERPARDKK
jgi:ribosomal protein S18 acetylase RimI-like enzyme